MSGQAPQVLGSSVALGSAAVLPVTGDNKVIFVSAASLFVLGLTTLIISKVVTAKNQ